MILETSKERVEFLKVGFSGKEIEEKYLRWNHIKIVKDNILKNIET